MTVDTIPSRVRARPETLWMQVAAFGVHCPPVVTTASCSTFADRTLSVMHKQFGGQTEKPIR